SPRHPRPTPFPYTTLFRSPREAGRKMREAGRDPGRFGAGPATPAPVSTGTINYPGGRRIDADHAREEGLGPKFRARRNCSGRLASRGRHEDSDVQTRTKGVRRWHEFRTQMTAGPRIDA